MIPPADGFPLGPLYIRFYGIILMLGAVAGGWLATREVKRRGGDPDMVWDLLVYLIIGGVIGARLWHILTPPESSIERGLTTVYYLTHPLDAIAIWNGGLGIPGTVIGGLVALWIYTRRNQTLSFLDWTDIAAPSLALGQAIGRWGNFFNQELYGAPTTLPWAILIDEAHRPANLKSVPYYHPLFAYESLLNLANMLLLLWLLRGGLTNRKRGDIFNVYLITYPLIRFGLEFLRLDSPTVLGIPHFNQWFVAVVGVAAIVVFVWRHRPGSEEPSEYSFATSESEPEPEPAPADPEPEEQPKPARKSAPRKRAAVKKAAAKTPARRKTAGKTASKKAS